MQDSPVLNDTTIVYNVPEYKCMPILRIGRQECLPIPERVSPPTFQILK